MKKILLSIFCISIFIFSNAQIASEISSDKPVVIDDIEYGYMITNESIKEAGGKEMSRYVVTLYGKNTSTCLKLFLFENRSFLGSSSAENDLAKFNCVNATGQRLTSKGGTVELRSFYANAKVPLRGTDGKTINQDIKVQIGYALRPSETVTKSIIIICPLGEKPKIQVSPIFNLPTY